MVFGVFDGLHPGHRSFLRQAKRYGKELIVVVARDSAVRKLKKKEPIFREKKRLAAVRQIKGVNIAVLGDHKQGVYEVIKRYKSDIICFGYDQKLLEEDLRTRMRVGVIPKIPIARVGPFRPRKFHSSLLGKSSPH